MTSPEKKRSAPALVALLVVLALMATACGGGSDDAAPAGEGASSTDTTGGSDATDGSGATESAETPTETSTEDVDTSDQEDEAGTYEPGGVEYRAVNLLDVPVDVYLRTSGLVQAFPVQLGLAPGEVTDFIAPPDRGTFLVTDAGAGDPTCVSGCDHFISATTSFPEEGPVRTVLIYEDEFSGPSGYELWEQPTADRTSSANAIGPAQDGRALATILAVAVTEADFGLRLGIDGGAGCLTPVNTDNVLVGGNQTPTFDLTSATGFSFYDSQDLECSGDVVGGPFPFAGSETTRTFVFLSGSPGAMDALQLPMTVGEVVAATSDAPASAGGDRDLVVAFMTDEVLATFPVAETEAACISELIVDKVGVDLLYVDGVFADLDSFPPEVNQLAGEALFESVAACGIDPSVFDG